MYPQDWSAGEHTKIWACSELWKNSEAVTRLKKEPKDEGKGEGNGEGKGEGEIEVIPPNFPPTYQCSTGKEKVYGLCKKRNGEVYDVRTPSWTEQLLILK